MFAFPNFEGHSLLKRALYLRRSKMAGKDARLRCLSEDRSDSDRQNAGQQCLTREEAATYPAKERA